MSTMWHYGRLGGPHYFCEAYRASYGLLCFVPDIVPSYYTSLYYTYGWLWTYVVPGSCLIYLLIDLYLFNIMYILCIVFIPTNNYISFYVIDWDWHWSYLEEVMHWRTLILMFVALVLLILFVWSLMLCALFGGIIVSHM